VRSDAVVQQSSDGLANWLAGMKNATLVRGHARFTGRNEIAIGARSLRAAPALHHDPARDAHPSYGD
jgi:pyruvate/2-oxoglutarate dehydrogenase complex dihydrolipoamide dehydrogenase (E3) component